MKHQYALVAGWSLAAFFSVSAAAEIATFSGSKDTTMYSESGALSNGAGEYLFSGITGRNGDNATRRALIAFDLSSIAPGAVVNSVELVLSVLSAGANAVQSPFSLFRMTSNWGEGASNAGSPGGRGATALVGDATWSHRFYDTQTWSTTGGDFVSTASAGRTVSEPAPGGTPLPFTWGSTPEMVADVQSWIDNPSTNFGWILRGAGNGSETAARFASSEYSLGDSFRPTLVINYAPIPEPSAALLLLPGAAVLVVAARRRRRHT